MSKRYHETTSSLSDVESDLLRRIRDFYQRAVGWDAAQQITGLEITDRYYKPGRPPRYRVQLYLSTANKGPFIGRGGATINQLRKMLNLEIDL
jgi:ribosomal protein S3